MSMSKYSLAGKISAVLEGEDINTQLDALRIVSVELYTLLAQEEEMMDDIMDMEVVGGVQ